MSGNFLPRSKIIINISNTHEGHSIKVKFAMKQLTFYKGNIAFFVVRRSERTGT